MTRSSISCCTAVRLDRLAPLRQLAQRRYIHVAERRNRQRSRDRRRRHRQHIGIHPFAPQDAALIHPEAVLLVRDDQSQTGGNTHPPESAHACRRSHRSCPSARRRAHPAAGGPSSCRSAGPPECRKGSNKPLQRALMLLGQNLRRHHQRALASLPSQTRTAPTAATTVLPEPTSPCSSRFIA